MDDYGYHQQHASFYPVPNNALALYDPHVTNGFFSEGLLPAYDQFLYDPFLIQTDQLSCQSMVVNEGFDQFEPLYAPLDYQSLESPMSLVCGRPSFGSSESVGTESFGSPLLWGDELVNNSLNNGAAMLCNQVQQPVQVQVSTVVETNECVNNVVPKNMPRLSGRKRTKKQYAHKKKECDTSGNSNNSVADALTWDILSQYFYLPIAQAASELNIGLTIFKKRCRELGVRRWPHRKLMSIQSLINSVKELEKNGELNPAVSKATVKNAVELLEKQRKTMEIMPDTELETQTKRLRQACFKANYKKRRLMIMNGGCSDNSSGDTGTNNVNESFVNNGIDAQELEDSYELKSLLFDTLSPADCSFLSDYNI